MTTIYLHEVIECIPNKTDEYLDFVETKYFPLADKIDAGWLIPCGFWKPRTTYGKWSQAVFLYQVQSWETWLTYFGLRSKEGNKQFHDQFYTPALNVRSGWFDKTLIRMPFSPEPPARPQIVRTGSLFLDHSISVRPDSIPQFIAAMRDVVIPAAAKRGLRLEFMGRVMCKPTDFQAIWSVPGLKELAAWRNEFDPEAVAPNLPGFDAAWPYVVNFEERDLIPSYTSALGGIAPNASKDSGVSTGLRTSATGGSV
jgi:hypothetical protein